MKLNPKSEQDRFMFIETTTLSDLQSPLPQVRVRALEILYRNACMLYGETNPTTVAERLRLEAARSKLVQNNPDPDTDKTNI